MLLEFSVEGFKAFCDQEDITLAPLTLVYGPNSGGKSSLLEAIRVFLSNLEDSSVVPGIGAIGEPESIFNGGKSVHVPECSFKGTLSTQKGVLKYQRKVHLDRRYNEELVVDSFPNIETRQFYQTGNERKGQLNPTKQLNGLWKENEEKTDLVFNAEVFRRYLKYESKNLIKAIKIKLKHTIDKSLIDKVETLKQDIENLKYDKKLKAMIDTSGLSEYNQKLFKQCEILRVLFFEVLEAAAEDLAHRTHAKALYFSQYVLSWIHDLSDYDKSKGTEAEFAKLSESAIKLGDYAEESMRIFLATFNRAENSDFLTCFGLLADEEAKNKRKESFSYNEIIELIELLSSKDNALLVTFLNYLPLIPIFRNRRPTVSEHPVPENKNSWSSLNTDYPFINVKVLFGSAVRPGPKIWYEKQDFIQTYDLKHLTDRGSTNSLETVNNYLDSDFKELTKGQKNQVTSCTIKKSPQQLGAGFVINFTTAGSDAEVNIRHMGAGISQILPIFMQFHNTIQETSGGYINRRIRYDRGTYINIIQQPELHLHPRQQANLADIFVDFCIKGENRRQLICETHSELLVERVQKRIRQGSIKPEDVCVLYVNPTGNHSEIIQLRMDSDGDFIDEWPDGFFEDSYNELFSEDGDDGGRQ